MLDAFIIDQQKQSEQDQWEPLSLPLEGPKEMEEVEEDSREERGVWTIHFE